VIGEEKKDEIKRNYGEKGKITGGISKLYVQNE